jgi:hypothetical protein
VRAGSKGEGPSLSGGGARQTLFLFPEWSLRESGTAAWAHYPRADSGLLGRCDTDVTGIARGTELGDVFLVFLFLLFLEFDLVHILIYGRFQ